MVRLILQPQGKVQPRCRPRHQPSKVLGGNEPRPCCLRPSVRMKLHQGAVFQHIGRQRLRLFRWHAGPFKRRQHFLLRQRLDLRRLYDSKALADKRALCAAASAILIVPTDHVSFDGVDFPHQASVQVQVSPAHNQIAFSDLSHFGHHLSRLTSLQSHLLRHESMLVKVQGHEGSVTSALLPRRVWSRAAAQSFSEDNREVVEIADGAARKAKLRKRGPTFQKRW